jgi:hypothetical protein
LFLFSLVPLIHKRSAESKHPNLDANTTSIQVILPQPELLASPSYGELREAFDQPTHFSRLNSAYDTSRAAGHDDITDEQDPFPEKPADDIPLKGNEHSVARPSSP